MARTIEQLARAAALLLIALAAALPALAGTGQYYLVGRAAPAGSITSGGQGQQVVYLRWDALEGDLPADVVRLKLVRDGTTVLLDQPVDAVMDAASIEVLYAGAANERRLVETLRGLKEQAIAEGRDFDLGDFATAIEERIDPGSAHYDDIWTFLASRGDVNVARARYRAFVDDPGPGEFDYELLAVNGVGAEVRLGFARVSTLVSQDILAPSDFRQVLQAQCDLPELGLDHYTVALDWTAPGDGNPADRVASQIYVAGYDLYRTTENLDPLATSAPVRDVRAEAAAVSFDNRGEPVLAGLEKVNDTLLTISPDGELEPSFEQELGGVDIVGGLIPEWLETRDQLERAGLSPGDKRAYYLVPRDFTGNYGATLAAVVVVPNMIRPPAPWELRPFVDQVGRLSFPPEAGLAISWDKVDVDNYLAAYQGTRVFCNTTEARQTGVLEFVAHGESCDDDVRRTVRLDVSTYRVYRFADFDEAARFKDSDGDGVSDALEREDGLQCDPAAQPVGAEGRALSPPSIGLREITLPESGRKIMRFTDLSPQSEPGEVFWYRVASRTPEGRLSVLSAPQRGLYPDRTPPGKPQISMVRAGREEDGGCELDVDRTGGSWSFSEELDGLSFVVTCGSGERFPVLSDDLVSDGSDQTCQDIVSICDQAGAGTVTIKYPEKNGQNDRYACEITVPNDLPAEDQDLVFCGAGGARLVPTYREASVPVNTGDVTGDGAAVFVGKNEGEPDTCLSLYENIDGSYTKVASSCGDPDDPAFIRYDVESGFFCGYAVAHDENNNISASAQLPCTTILPEARKAPATPQPVDFSVSDQVADVGWRLPIEPVAVTLVRLEHRPGDGTRTREIHAVPSPGSGGGDVVRHAVDVPALAGPRDEWCVSLLAVGPNAIGSDAQSSDWSSPRCVSRRADGDVVPEYLPWPAVEAAPEGRALRAGVQGILGFGLLYVDVTRVAPIDQSTLLRNCRFDPQRSIFFLDTKCAEEGKLLSDALLDPVVHFVVYRQSRGEDQVGGDWIQVSPLIEFAHWDDYEPVDPEPKFIGRYLRDPYIHLRRSDADPDAIGSFAFVDRYPYAIDREYRYQLVYFSDDHRIVQRRVSNWTGLDLAGLQGASAASAGEGGAP